MNGKCKNCGGDGAIHHYQTNQCPVGGRGAPMDRPTIWQENSFFAPDDSEEKRELLQLRQRCAELEERYGDCAKENMKLGAELRQLRAWYAESIEARTGGTL
jgi:hypothetical protein